MGRYLDALKKSENGGEPTLINLKNPPSPSILGFLGSPPPTFEINHAANDPLPGTRHFRWLIHFPDRDPVEHTFLPELTHAEVLEWHQDATAAEPIPERIRIKATPEQEAELRALVASVSAAYGFTHAEQQEALDLALWDVDAALQSYRVMANEQNIILDRDDRRRCDQCANLSHRGKCAAWQAVGAMNGYSPVPDIPRRCEGYAPGPEDADRRPGRERWPGLTDTKGITRPILPVALPGNG